MPEEPEAGRTGTWALAAVAAALLCCAGPSLLVALGLGTGGAAIGAFLGQPIVVAAAAVVVLGVAAVVLARRR